MVQQRIHQGVKLKKQIKTITYLSNGGGKGKNIIKKTYGAIKKL